MKFFYNLKLSAKLIISFFLILALTAGLGAFSIIQLVKVNNNVVAISSNLLPSVQSVLEMKAALARYRTQTFQHVLATEANRGQFEQMIKDSIEKFGGFQKSFTELVLSPEEQGLTDDLARQWHLYNVENEKILELSRKGQTEEAVTALRGRSTKLNRDLIETIDQLVTLNNASTAKASKDSEASYKLSLNMIGGLLAGSIILGMVLALWIARIISMPIKAAVKVAQTVAAGDLTSEIEVKTKDETGQLLLALKAMNSNLVKIVGEVRSGTETIATASSQIAQGNLDLSSRTEEQASSLEETASSMEELTSTVQQNADNARQADNLAASAAAVAHKGGQVVANVVTTMGHISDSAKKIEQIIGVIDSIAFQTNILALNAAVEAARAGEQGRGFAVVAAEVRSLAQKSAGAAKEIKGLIDASVTSVEEGTKLVGQAGATMNEIVVSVQHVTDIMGEITAASQEQASSIQQINQAIMQMDQVTQQNASLVEEAAAASESMQDQAVGLAKAVGVFKL
jgi:methyl-accepting chemotaxis protein